MPKHTKIKQTKTNKIPLLLRPFNTIGRFTMQIVRSYQKAYKNFVYVILKLFEIIGRLVVFPFVFSFWLIVFILEKTGQLTIFLIASLIRLPALPFIVLWDLWLFISKSAIRKQKVKILKIDFSTLINNLKTKKTAFNQDFRQNPNPGVQFCYRFVRSPLRLTLTAVIFFSLISGSYYWIFKDLPSPYKLNNPPVQSTKIYARDCETLLYKVYRNENRSLVPLEEIPEHVRQATIAIEDKEFYQHHGYSLAGIIRAFKNNMENGKVQGGSTITQQLVKNTVLTSERTVERKIKELLISLQTEIIFSKDQILQMYLNEVAYGGPAYGIQEASQMYFGKSIRDVDLAEASFLAGLPAAPSKNSPYLTGNMKASKNRQKEVLTQMVKAGFIDSDKARQTYSQKLAVLPPNTPIRAPHFVMYVKDQLERTFGQNTVEEGGLTVCTSLDPVVQQFSEKIVADEINKIKTRYQVSNGASLVTNPSTGEILAMVGSVDFWDKENDGNVNLTTAQRQPGSSIKVVNYTYALSHGYNPSSVIYDTPVSYSNAWETYTPKNYDGKFRGPVTLKQAMAQSLNVPAVKVLASYGPDKMKFFGRKMGITTWDNLTNYGLSLTLGAAEVKMVDMAVVYGTIANAGKKVPLDPFVKIVDNQGNILKDKENKKPLLAGLAKEASAYEGNNEQIVPDIVAWQLVDIMSDNSARAPAFGPKSDLYIPDKKVAVKTGTSNEMRDNWTIGFTPNILVATWVGNNDNTPMAGISSGLTGASPIWNKTMNQMIDSFGAEEFPVPEGMVKIEVCAVNGLLTCEGCPQTKIAYFAPGQEPKKKCSFPKPSACRAKKAKMEEEGKSSEEIVKALKGCPLADPSPKPEE